MRNLPVAIIHVLRQFEGVFSDRVWQWAKVLVVGAILAPGTRTVTAALCVMGLSQERQFQNYHRVLNRATWASRALSRILLRLLIRAFVPPTHQWSSAWMTILSGDAASPLPPKASTAMPCAPASRSSSRVVGCAGCR